jgi:hypothetical protein
LAQHKNDKLELINNLSSLVGMAVLRVLVYLTCCVTPRFLYYLLRLNANESLQDVGITINSDEMGGWFQTFNRAMYTDSR